MNNEKSPPRFMRAREVAEYLGISEAVLTKYRQNGTGPRYYQPGGIGSLVLYKPEDVEAWLEAGASSSGSEETAEGVEDGQSGAEGVEDGDTDAEAGEVTS